MLTVKAVPAKGGFFYDTCILSLTSELVSTVELSFSGLFFLKNRF
jgi:hypothetical protein